MLNLESTVPKILGLRMDRNGQMEQREFRSDQSNREKWSTSEGGSTFSVGPSRADLRAVVLSSNTIKKYFLPVFTCLHV